MKPRAIALVAVVTTIVAIAAGTCKDQVAPELARATAGGDVALETAAACDSTHYKAVRPYLDSLNKYTTKGNTPRYARTSYLRVDSIERHDTKCATTPPPDTTKPPPIDTTHPPPPDTTTPPPAGGSCAMVGDAVYRAEPTGVSRPGYLQSFVDPLYGTTITRVTGDAGTQIGATGAAWQQVNTHNYSKDPAWNADGSLLILKRVIGVGTVMLDGRTYQPLKLISGAPGETRWHPTNPAVMLYESASCSVGEWNPMTGANTVRYTASGYSNCNLGPYEGNPSRDGNVVAIHGTRTSDGKDVAFLVTLSTGTRTSDVETLTAGFTAVDWVSASELGAYLVINGNVSGLGGDRTRVFAPNGALVQTWAEYGRPSHYDFGKDASGNEVAVGVSKSAPDEGKVIMRRLDNGAVTVLTKGGYAAHTSTRNNLRPGWAYVSHSYNGPNWLPYRDEVLAVKLDGTQTVERWGNMHSLNGMGSYNAEPHAVPAPDGKRVLFASAWEASGAVPVHAYVTDNARLCK